MELTNNELRRELNELNRMNADAMPAWRETLKRMVGGGTDMSVEEKAAALGVPVPGRRNFFKIGGATILGAAVIAACGSDDDDTAGTTGGTTGSDDMDDMGDGNMDLVLAKTAASLEQLAIDVYGNPDAGALLETEGIIAAAGLFAEHHIAHRDALNGVITGAGGDAVETANQAAFDALVKPSLEAASTEQDVVAIAIALEEAAAQTYVFAGGALSTPALRSTIMTIGGVEARHAVVLRMVAAGQGALEPFPGERAFWPAENPLSEDMLIK